MYILNVLKIHIYFIYLSKVTQEIKIFKDVAQNVIEEIFSKYFRIAPKISNKLLKKHSKKTFSKIKKHFKK